MAGRGGYMPGGGRPKKVDEERVRDLSVKAIVAHYGSEELGFKYLLNSKEPSLIKFVFEHAYGKPREKMDLDIDSPLGNSIIIAAPAGIEINLPDNTEDSDQPEEDAEGSTPVQE
jgi:hypothetical protein